jgi:hypothetical protein
VGTEYTIRSGGRLDRVRVDALLRGLPHFARFETDCDSYEFRHPDNPGKMPNVAVKLESAESVYVCDYGGPLMAAHIIGALVIHCALESNAPVELRLID